MDRIEQSRVWIIVIIKTIGRRFTTDIQIMKNLKKPEDAEDKCVVLSTKKKIVTTEYTGLGDMS